MDFFNAAFKWFQDDRFPNSLNDTNIVLIPKSDNPDSMHDLKSVSLCNMMYKILSKVLAIHMKKVLDKCIFLE